MMGFAPLNPSYFLAATYLLMFELAEFSDDNGGRRLIRRVGCAVIARDTLLRGEPNVPGDPSECFEIPLTAS